MSIRSSHSAPMGRFARAVVETRVATNRVSAADACISGIAVGAAALVLASGTVAFAGQQPEAAAAARPGPPTTFVSGSGNFSPMVADLDKTVAFYHDVLGLTLSAAESARPVPWDAEPWHRDLHGSQGSPMRFATARVPGSRLAVEMVEQSSIERHPVTLRIQDPGNVGLVLLVRDVDKIFAAAKKAGAPVVTVGGVPLDVGTPKSRAVTVKDPDGHYVVFLQPNPLPATTAPPESNLIGSRIVITVADTEQTLRLYRDQFGLQFEDVPFMSDKATTALVGLKGAQIRCNISIIPGSNSQLEFIEVKGIDRKPIRSHIEDPGSTRFQLSVRNLEQATAMLKAAGSSTVVSNTGKILPDGSWEKGPIDRTNVRWLTVTDLNNVFLVLSDRPAGAPARGAPGGGGREGRGRGTP